MIKTHGCPFSCDPPKESVLSVFLCCKTPTDVTDCSFHIQSHRLKNSSLREESRKKNMVGNMVSVSASFYVSFLVNEITKIGLIDVRISEV